MSQKLNLFDFKLDRIRILHYSWIAFFISFMVWFAHAALMPAIRDYFDLTTQQVKVLLVLNVAMTIPARIIVGMLVDRLGPRIMFAAILSIGGVISIFFALANDYNQLAMMRFLCGFVGAGFVVGIRLISEWFPAKQTGIAQGIYGGWGNFGSAGAALLLPYIALHVGGQEGWRYAIIMTGILAILYSFVYYYKVRDTPKGSTYFKPKKMGAMEVTSYLDLLLYMLMNAPMFIALAVLNWKLSPEKMGLLNQTTTTIIYIALAGFYILQLWKIWQVNRPILEQGVPEMQRYQFKQVAILDLAYMITFGTELAVVSMLPLFYVDTFGLSLVTAGILAGIYPVINLFARPAGGLISDRIGRRITLIIVMLGIAVSFFVLSFVKASWALPVVVLTTIMGGIFSKAGSGAVYAMVPLIQRRMTGQIAGMAGAFGNVGGVVFLTVLSFVEAQQFFLFIGAAAAVVFLFIMIFLDEPKGQMVETLPDGTVQLIDVK